MPNQKKWEGLQTLQNLNEFFPATENISPELDKLEESINSLIIDIQTKYPFLRISVKTINSKHDIWQPGEDKIKILASFHVG